MTIFQTKSINQQLLQCQVKKQKQIAVLLFTQIQSTQNIQKTCIFLQQVIFNQLNQQKFIKKSQINRIIFSKQQMSQMRQSLISKLGSFSLSPEMKVKARQMIRKKASLYGLEQLSNPFSYNRQNSMNMSYINSIKNSLRSKSSLAQSSLNLNNSNNKKSTLINSQYLTNSREQIQNTVSPKIPSYKLNSKTNMQSLFPPLYSLNSLIKDEKLIIYVLKDKLEYDVNDIAFEYLKILELAIKYQSDNLSEKINHDKSIIIETLEFLAQSFLECKFDKIAIVFSMIGVHICQFYKRIQRIGKFLFIMAKVLRRIFKYQQSVLVLKKALEYVWYGKKIYQNEQKQKQKQKQPQRHNNLAKINQIKLVVSSVDSLTSPNEHERNPRKIQQAQTAVHIPPQFQQMTNCQLQIYNELSYCLLQVSKKQQSRIFGEKYQIGYLEKQSSSSILSLSRDLVTSAQKRIVEWQRVDKRRFDMIFGVEIDKYLHKYEQVIKNKFQEHKLIKAFKINLDMMIDNFFKKDMFFYQMPLNTEMKSKEIDQFKKTHHKKLPTIQPKFVIKKKPQQKAPRSMSLRNQAYISKNRNEDVGQNKILNYRGIGLSRSRLVNLLRQYIHYLGTKLNANTLPSLKLSVPCNEQKHAKRDDSVKQHNVEFAAGSKHHN